MKKIFTLGVIFSFLFTLSISGTKVKEKKAKVITNEPSIEANISMPEVKSLPVKSQRINAGKLEIGNTDYDYGFNSGGTQSIVTENGKVHIVFNERDGINNLAAPANRRAVKYVHINGNTVTKGYPIPKATAQTGFGGVDAPSTGAATGFGMVVGHTPNWFAIDNAPGTANFAAGNLPGAGAGTVDPEVTFDNGRQRAVVLWTGMGGSRADYVVQYSDDFGVTWNFADAAGDSELCTGSSGTGKGHVANSLDVPVLVAPNGNYAIATTLTGNGATSPSDSADNIGYFKSTDGGANWLWNTVGKDGDGYVVGNDTLYAFYENFGQLAGVYDKNSKLNIVVNGYMVKIINDSTSANYFCTLYWKEGMTGFKVISNVNQMRSTDFDSYGYAGNAFGFAYPTIAADPTGNAIFSAWSQPSVTNGTVDTVAGGFAKMDIWYTASGDGGNTWSAASKIAGTTGGLYTWAARALDKNGSNYTAHLTYMLDTSAGTFVFGEGTRSLAPIMYESFNFTTSTTPVVNDTLYAFYENFGQLAGVYDKDSKLNIVTNGYLVKVINDSTSANYFCTLYWREGMTGFKVISNKNQMRSADFDSYGYAGNAFGFAYPTIAASKTGNTLFSAWSQPSVTNGKVDTVAGGFAKMDIWYTSSGNGGNTWSAASKIAGTTGGLYTWAARELDKNGNSYTAHLNYMLDTSAGTFVFGEGVRSLAPVMYEGFNFTQTSSIGDDNIVAKEFSLEQNYPNPFNPSTKINYSIATTSKVTLTIYNIMGQEVAKLVNGVQVAGKHSVNFDASKLSSGVYLYKLIAGSFQETKKMVLLK